MQVDEATQSIGSLVIARDEFWGTYTGILETVTHTRVGMVAKVRVLENIESPKQHAIFFPQNKYERLPYVKGTVKGFELANIKLPQNNIAQ